MRTGAAIFALVAGLAVLALMVWTLVGMIRSATRRSRGAPEEPSDDAPRGSADGSPNGSAGGPADAPP